jgi:hypothetical protein
LAVSGTVQRLGTFAANKTRERIMSATEPGRGGQGDGPTASVTEARGAVRTGRNIWILVISLALAVVLVLGYWAVAHAPRMQTLNHPQQRDLNTQDVSTFNTPAGSARQAPPGEPSTSGNSQ